MKALTTILVEHYYKGGRTDGALQRQQVKERDGLQRGQSETREQGKREERMERRGGMEKGEEGLCLPRRACFILGLSMVTVAVLLPLTET